MTGSGGRASARVDGTLRYRSSNEGVLCSARCRELSLSGLTAAIDRPAFPGDLVRFDLEHPSGGSTVTGLARVSWVGSDPESATGASVMRLRFISLGDAGERAVREWLQNTAERESRASDAAAHAATDLAAAGATVAPSEASEDSSVRALSRAIADSLLPPPPVLPGAPPSTESSGLTPVPIVVPNRPSIPPPPGMVRPRVSRGTVPPVQAGTQRTSQPSPPLPAAAPKTAAAQRAADVRARLSRLPPRADNTPLFVTNPLAVPRESRTSQAFGPAPSLGAAPVARVNLTPPLPLGALLDAPEHARTTRRSAPPPAGAAPPATGELASSSWPALRVPPEVVHGRRRRERATIPPPPELVDAAPLHAEAAPDSSARAAPQAYASAAPQAPGASGANTASDAPWSVPVPAALPSAERRAPRAGAEQVRWVAVWALSLAAGAGLAYVGYQSEALVRLRQDLAARVAGRATDAVAAARESETSARDGQRVGESALGAPSEAGQQRKVSAEEAALAAQMPLPPQLRGGGAIGERELPGARGQVPGASELLSGVTPAGKPAVVEPRLGSGVTAAGVGAAGAATGVALAAKPPASARATASVDGSGVAAEAGESLVGQPRLAAVPVSALEVPDALAPALAPPPPPALPSELATGKPSTAASPARAVTPDARLTPLQEARACVARGDTACVETLLKDANGEPELSLWIETLRAQGRGAEARAQMQRYLDRYPSGQRAQAYLRILQRVP